ncbi:MAG TPA: signal peptidase I [Candidatus Angelobacter sp.]|nr:signal peptidase I [Candidatus Angelobacter sp.]
MEIPEQATPASSAAPAGNPSPQTSGLEVLHSWIRDLIFALLVIFLIFVFLYEPVKVDGGSMEPGLEDQEHIFINKVVYHFESINRGDIIVFRYPRDTHKSFIKRVIGLPGDRIRISYGHVYVNGELQPEPYVPPDYQDARSFAETVVPNNAYFVLGDHRSMSNDSREFGPVMRSYIYGKAVFGYWPMEKLGALH